MYYPTNQPYWPMYPGDGSSWGMSPGMPMGMPGSSGWGNNYGGGYSDWFYPPQSSDGIPNFWDTPIKDYGVPYNQPAQISMSEQDAIRILSEHLEQVDNLPGTSKKKTRDGMKDGQISESDLQAVLKSDDDDDISEEMKSAAQTLLAGGTLKRMEKTDKVVENGPDFEFRKAMETFCDGRARELMDWLEWDQNHDQAQAHNGRFGTNGMQLLSQLTPDSPKWEEGAKDLPSIPKEERQRFIDAAKAALKPENKGLLDQVHGGDGIFEWEDIPNWSGSHKPTTSVKSAPVDGKVSFDMFKKWTEDYTTNSRRADGPADIKKAMDILYGNIELFQDGDPNKKVINFDKDFLPALNSDNPKYSPQVRAAVQYLQDHKDEYNTLDALDGLKDGGIQVDVMKSAISVGTTHTYGWDINQWDLSKTTREENRAAWNVVIGMWEKLESMTDGENDNIVAQSDIKLALSDHSGKFTPEERQALIRIFQVKHNGISLWDQVKTRKKHIAKDHLERKLADGKGLAAKDY